MSNGYEYEDHLCLIKTNKYKTIELFLNFSCPYDRKTLLSLKMLDYYMGDYSLKHPNKEAMLKAKDDCYGANLSCSTKVKTNLIEVFVRYSFINPIFLKDLTTADFLDFFKECFYDVFFDEKLLDEFKRNYRDRIGRYLDKPSSFALNRVWKTLAEKEERLLIYDVSQGSDIDEITISDVRRVYDSLMRDFALDITLIGDYDDTLLDFVRTLKTEPRFYLTNESYEIEDLGEITEEKDISQSILNVVYATPNNRYNKDFYAYTLGAVLLGVVPTSLLFEEVREKLSLCYYISVHDYKNEGLVRIHTAIDGKNKDKVISEIERQIKRLADKDYDPVKLELARSLFIDSLRSTPDDAADYQEYLYHNVLNGIDVPFADYEKGLLKVTVDDISRVFRNYKHVLTYMLKGTGNEEGK
ncbi:MAG: insulinase family protein [Erysipelotrichaceae bacterium]|nr:insulinase family protein [Erysipelotrichaceae bacterium]